jgi:hypothetical protein
VKRRRRGGLTSATVSSLRGLAQRHDVSGQQKDRVRDVSVLGVGIDWDEEFHWLPSVGPATC